MMKDWYDDGRTRIYVSKDEHQKEHQFRQKFQGWYYLIVLLFAGLLIVMIKNSVV